MLDQNPPAARSPHVDADAILGYLTTQQHLHPKSTVQQILESTIEQFNCCPEAVSRAQEWLKLNGQSPIGRLRRGELIQLARVVHRFWGQAATVAPIR